MLIIRGKSNKMCASSVWRFKNTGVADPAKCRQTSYNRKRYGERAKKNNPHGFPKNDLKETATIDAMAEGRRFFGDEKTKKKKKNDGRPKGRTRSDDIFLSDLWPTGTTLRAQ